jgi:hypothetical protein
VSSEINFNFEYAQMEVTMKALGSNGEHRLCLQEGLSVFLMMPSPDDL